MATNMADGNGRTTRIMRVIAWGGAAALLLLPLIAMQFTDEVRWTPFDFGIFALMLGMACGGFEILLRRNGRPSYIWGSAIALGTAFLLVWINLAVGIVGSEDDPANGLFLLVLFVALAGSLFGGFSPSGMARAMLATAIAQMAAGLAAVGGYGLHAPIVVLTLVFAALWLAAAILFARSA